MYTNSNVSDSPNYFMTLNAIDKGLTRFCEHYQGY